MFQQLVFRHLSRLDDGLITIRDGQQSWSFGNQDAELVARIDVQRPRFYRRIVLGGGLGAADAWIDGDWSCDDLTALLRIFARQSHVSAPLDRGIAWLRSFVARIAHRLRRNSPAQARKNIQRHYDLSNEFFSLWLDPTMAYSCGVFPAEDTTLQEASLLKFDRACRKLNLQANDHLLEIGTGWGGLAIFAATHYGCRVTTTTISERQFHESQQRVAAAGLSDRITVLRQDYRDLQGEYDKLVSIEMIEAVGYEYFDTFFRQCGRLLRPDGMLLLQAIVMQDQSYRAYLKNVDFIRTHIFPGGCLPSNSEILNSVKRTTDFRLLHLEDFAPHYARTLREWTTNFRQNNTEIEQLGFDESFKRLWLYYLCYCEAAFEERHVNLVQMLFAKAKCRFDVTSVNLQSSEFSLLMPLEENL